MAVRFTASGQTYSRTISLGSITQLSVTCWAKISTDRNDTSAIWSIDDNNSVTRETLQTASDGTSLEIAEGFSFRSLVSLTAGTWYYIGISVNGDTGTAVIQPVGSSATISTWSDGARTSTTANNLRIGNNPSGFQFLNGCVAAVKVWTGATLSQAELEAETWTYLPQRTADLKGWYPFLTPSTVDYSGNGWTLSGGSGTTTEDGPPIPWRTGRPRIVVAAAASELIDGTLAADLPTLSGAVEGAVTAAGLLAGQLAPIDGSAAGIVTVTGQADADLPALTSALTGDVSAPGLLDGTLPALQGAFTGELTGGFLVASLPALEGNLDGHLLVDGHLDAVLPALASSLSGVVEIPHNDFTPIAGPPQRGWAARTPTSAWAADPPQRAWTARQPTTT